MFGKPEWFARRKYGGWGMNPKTWQGWLYMFALIAPLALIMQLADLDALTLAAVTFVWFVLVALEMADIMSKIKKDERERQIEALAERNATWAMVAVITVGVGYQAASSAAHKAVMVDPFLIATLIAGWIAKAASNWYLERRM